MKTELRLAAEQDAERIVAWRNLPHVRTRFFYRTPLTLEAHTAWVQEQIKTSCAVQFVILAGEDDCTKEALRPVGLCCLQHIGNGSADYGFLIGETDALGKGIGTQATLLAVRYAKETLHLQTLTAKVMEGNEASLKSFAKAGFVVTHKAEETCTDGEPVVAVYLRKDL